MGIAAVIATAFREKTLPKTLRALNAQTLPPARVVIVDSAPAPGAEPMVDHCRKTVQFPIDYLRSPVASAALQRNRGVENVDEEFILFVDDDLYPEPDCLKKLAAVMEQDGERSVGGVGILLRNQLAPAPRRRAKKWFDFLADDILPSYGGKVIGPAVNLYHEPTHDQGVKDVDWLNTTCVLYRRDAFLEEQFSSFFMQYSFMEDVDLSVRIARKWKLKVHTGAYGFHDSQPSRFKRPYLMGKMSVVNRYYVMTKTLGRVSLRHHLKFIALIGFAIVFPIRSIHDVNDVRAWLGGLLGILVGLVAITPRVVARLGRRLFATHPSSATSHSRRRFRV